MIRAPALTTPIESASLMLLLSALDYRGIDELGSRFERYVSDYNTEVKRDDADAAALSVFLTSRLPDSGRLIQISQPSGRSYRAQTTDLISGLPEELLALIQCKTIEDYPTSAYTATARLISLSRVSQKWRTVAKSISLVYNLVNMVASPWCASRRAAWAERVGTCRWTFDLSYREYCTGADYARLMDCVTNCIVLNRATLHDLRVSDGPLDRLIQVLFPESVAGESPPTSWLFEDHIAPKALRSFTLSLTNHAPYFLRRSVFRVAIVNIVCLRLPFDFQVHGITAALCTATSIFPHCTSLELEDTGSCSNLELYALLTGFETATQELDLRSIRNLYIKLPIWNRAVAESSDGNKCLVIPVVALHLAMLHLGLFSWRRFQIVNLLRRIIAPNLIDLEIDEYVTRRELENESIAFEDERRPLVLATVAELWPDLLSLDYRSATCTLDIIPYLSKLRNLRRLAYHNVSWTHINMIVCALSTGFCGKWIAPELWCLDLSPVKLALPLADLVRVRTRICKLKVNVCSPDRHLVNSAMENIVWALIGTCIDLIMVDEHTDLEGRINAGWFRKDWSTREGPCNSSTHAADDVTKNRRKPQLLS